MKDQRKPYQLRPQRIEWLIANDDLWSDSPQNLFSSANPTWRDHWRFLVQRMKDANLVSQKTYWRDVNIHVLIKDARNKIEDEKKSYPEGARSSTRRCSLPRR